MASATKGEDPKTPRESSEDQGHISAREMAERVGYNRNWLLRMAREGLIPHIRVGRPPQPGRKDTRPVRFTPAQAAEVEALLTHVEHRPSGGAA